MLYVILRFAHVEFARAGLHEPQVIRLDTETKISEALQIQFFTVRHDEKLGSLLFVMTELIPTGQQTIVFAATRYVLCLRVAEHMSGGRMLMVLGAVIMWSSCMAC